MSISISKHFKFLAVVLTHLIINGWMVGSYTGGILTAGIWRTTVPSNRIEAFF